MSEQNSQHEELENEYLNSKITTKIKRRKKLEKKKEEWKRKVQTTHNLSYKKKSYQPRFEKPKRPE